MRTICLRGFELARLIDVAPDTVAAALDHPLVTRWVGCPYTRYRMRQARDLDGDSLTLVIYDSEGVAGTVGLLPYEGDPAYLETTTFLVPRRFGSGLNRTAKVIQWSLGLMFDRPLLASVNADNGRSRASMRKLYPQGSEQHVFEPWEPRQAVLFPIGGPPYGERSLDQDEQEAVRTLLGDHPALKRLKKTPVDERAPSLAR